MEKDGVKITSYFAAALNWEDVKYWLKYAEPAGEERFLRLTRPARW
jgi:hypothetical protein